MRILRDYRTNEFEIHLSEHELKKAFSGEQELQKLFHEIVCKTYGRTMADDLFPLKGCD